MSTKRGFYLGEMFERAAAKHGGVPVVLDRPLDVAPDAGTEHTYLTLAELVGELAARLSAAGVRRGDRVAVYKSDNIDIALLTCALSRLGAVPALLSPTLTPGVVAQLLAKMDRPRLLSDRAKLTGELAPAELPALAKEVLLVGAGAAELARETGGTALETHAGAPRPALVRVGPKEPALITHSSGTTGLPKLAVHCPYALWNRLIPQQVMNWPSRGETAALCVSYVHSRFYHALGVFLGYGSKLLLMVEHDPASVGPLLTRMRPGIVETHPNTFVLWEELADAPGAPLSNVGFYGSTFDAIHPRTIRRLLGASRRKSPVLIQLYGQSETGPAVARFYTRKTAAKENGRLVGIGLPGFTRVRVVDDNGRPCPAGQAGHIEVRTRGRILTYLGGADKYAEQLNDGWWRMGDVGYRNRWGGLYLIDREIDQIDAVDSNLELEDILMSRLPELREIVVVPGLDDRAVPVVCTRNDEPLAPERWRDALAGLPELAEPVVCRFEDLPRTGTWKIKRLEIAELLRTSQSLSRNWIAS
jgi:acyl-coenzyme A synthetase/AMP-(fatty) acid ligase